MYSFSVQNIKNFFGLVEPLEKLWKCKRFQSVSRKVQVAPKKTTRHFIIPQIC